jgi:hypothetical protein
MDLGLVGVWSGELRRHSDLGEVADAAAELEQLGSRFYRASNAVRLGITGTGLGLRIVQSILENHHGSLDLRSEQGVGTTIRIRLPIHAADPVRSAERADPAGAGAGYAGTTGPPRAF